MTGTRKQTEESSPWLDADEIKSRVSIESILSHYGILDRLKRKGARLTGLSPFREEKSPSFTVNTEKNIWNDFGGKPNVPGNVIGLVQALENCSFREALVILHRDYIGEVIKEENERGTGVRPPKSEDPTPELIGNHVFGKKLKGLRFDVPLLREKGIAVETCKEFGCHKACYRIQ